MSSSTASAGTPGNPGSGPASTSTKTSTSSKVMKLGGLIFFKDPGDPLPTGGNEPVLQHLSYDSILPGSYPAWFREKIGDKMMCQSLDKEDRMQKCTLVMKSGGYKWQDVKIFARVEDGKGRLDVEEELDVMLRVYHEFILVKIPEFFQYNNLMDICSERFYKTRRVVPKFPTGLSGITHNVNGYVERPEFALTKKPEISDSDGGTAAVRPPPPPPGVMPPPAGPPTATTSSSTRTGPLAQPAQPAQGLTSAATPTATPATSAPSPTPSVATTPIEKDMSGVAPTDADATLETTVDETNTTVPLDTSVGGDDVSEVGAGDPADTGESTRKRAAKPKPKDSGKKKKTGGRSDDFVDPGEGTSGGGGGSGGGGSGGGRRGSGGGGRGGRDGGDKDKDKKKKTPPKKRRGQTSDESSDEEEEGTSSSKKRSSKKKTPKKTKKDDDDDNIPIDRADDDVAVVAEVSGSGSESAKTLGGRADVIAKLQNKDSKIMMEALYRELKKINDRVAKCEKSINDLKTGQSEIFGTSRQTKEAIQTINIEGSTAMQAVAGNPLQVAMLPWDTYDQMNDCLADPEKRFALIKAGQAHKISEKKAAADFFKLVFGDLFFHVMPANHSKTTPKGAPNVGQWMMGKPMYQINKDLEAVFLSVMKIKLGLEWTPMKAREFSAGFRYTEDNHFKRVAMRYMKLAVVSWYRHYGQTDIRGKALALVFFDHAKKTFKIDEDFPVDERGVPSNKENCKAFLQKWFPIVAGVWKEQDWTEIYTRQHPCCPIFALPGGKISPYSVDDVFDDFKRLRGSWPKSDPYFAAGKEIVTFIDAKIREHFAAPDG